MPINNTPIRQKFSAAGPMLGMRLTSIADDLGNQQTVSINGNTITVSEQTGGVAYWAHIGGFAAGLLLAFVLRPFVNGPTRFSTA